MNRFAMSLTIASMIPAFSYAATPNQGHPASHEMHMIMKGMCETMNGMEMSHEANQDFVKMMIPHHQSAVDMAKAYLKEGTDPEIVAMAEKIIESQQKEIEQLKTWQAQHASDSIGSHP